jgi:hypothetical protein
MSYLAPLGGAFADGPACDEHGILGLRTTGNALGATRPDDRSVRGGVANRLHALEPTLGRGRHRRRGKVGDGGRTGKRAAICRVVEPGDFQSAAVRAARGGKIFCSLLEKIHPRLARLHDGFAIVGLAVLLFLTLYTTVLDVVRQTA